MARAQIIAHCQQSVTCVVFDAGVEERGMVWPLLVEVAIGTMCWLASMVATVKVRLSAAT